MNGMSDDALSDILRLVRLKGCVYFQSDFSPPWGMHMEKGAFAQFHLVVRGQCWLRHDNDDHQLSQGDIAVLPHGDGHALSDTPASPTRPGPEVLAAIRSGRPTFGDGLPGARLLCGHFEFERELNHPLIRDLSPLILVKGIGHRQPGWLETIIPMLIGEAGAGQPGADTVVERLAEVLLIQVLRTHMMAQTEDIGFLAAIGDRRINGALKYIHLSTENDITLADIARTVGMSRSSLAVRFKELVGDTPMNYLTNWRLLRAKDMIMTGNIPLAEVAEQVGYTSEAAFSRAFKREYDQSPSAFRRTQYRGSEAKTVSGSSGLPG